MQEIANALEKLNEVVEALTTSLEAAQKVIDNLRAQLEGQAEINARVEQCLRYLLGVEKERPKLSLVVDESLE